MSRSHSLKGGLGIAVVLALVNLLGLVGINDPDAPPVLVTILALVLGLVTLTGVWVAWRGHRGGVAIVIAALLIDNVGLGVPSYFDPLAPPWLLIAVTTAIALTLAAIGLLMVHRMRSGGGHGGAQDIASRSRHEPSRRTTRQR